MERHPGYRPNFHLVLGLSVVALGVLFTLNNLHILQAREYLRFFWPGVFLVAGLVHISNARTSGNVFWGLVLTLVGGVMLSDRLGLWQVNVWAFWPLLLVLWGIHIIWQTRHFDGEKFGGSFGDRFGPRGWPFPPKDGPFPPKDGPFGVPGAARAGVDDGTRVSIHSVLGGIERRITSREFQGGDVTAFLGGCELDLRDAQLAGGQADLNVSSTLGGVEIRVPEHWNVVNNIAVFLGGVEDKTRLPSQSDASAPRLVLHGFVMLGGVEIRN